MKLMGKISANNGYYHPHWKRDKAPLLDELGATVDHVHAVSSGGINSLENYLTACSKCNLKKNNRPLEEWGRVLESLPTDWDGLSSLFVFLFNDTTADKIDKLWYKLLT